MLYNICNHIKTKANHVDNFVILQYLCYKTKKMLDTSQPSRCCHVELEPERPVNET